ncbi:solute carrier family 23 protein [Pseudoroseomonas cervicalis]|uniref:solute carrier family 23 protein n=1 Tax=Teichococcus cervicalis TaxID=204525 RepID=UPI0022F1B981|nr:solute carrier family 23 protein [Pseudoroseomonas cervicalis]WBV45206.1 purine/pyrimidine permease [Pseudoroseomonas cervicalis]
MSGALRRWLLAPQPPRQKPEEMAYGPADRPPLGVMLGMGLQHAALAMVFALYAAIAGAAMGYDPAQITAYVSATIFVMGCATLIQALPWRFGAGLPLVTIPSAGRLTIQVALMAQYGLGAMMGATLVAGLLTLGFARLIPRLRPVFPPEVIGVALVMMGLSLITGGVSRSLGMLAPGQMPALPELAAASATLAAMVALAIWGSPAWRRVAMLGGILAGTAVAAAAGAQTGIAPPQTAPLALPLLGLALPWPEFHLVPILVVCISQLVTMMDQMGGTLSMDRLTDAGWRRADLRLARRSLAGLGLSTLISGATGTPAGATSTAHIGLVHASGVAAWRVGAAAGLVLMLASLVPPLAALLVMVPSAVVGGILVYAAAYMISTGIEMIMSRLMTSRRSFTVGLAIVMGAAVMLMPELGRGMPNWLQGIARSGLIVGALTAILLNALFRIGLRRVEEAVLDPVREGAAAAELIERCGREWALRPDTVARAGHATGEALEALREAGIAGPVRLAASFDEFNLTVALHHAGPPLQLEAAAAPEADLLRQDDAALDAAMRRVSAALIRRLADRVRSARQGAGASVTLNFMH